MCNIAWGHLEKIEIAQLLHFKPELRSEYERYFGIKPRFMDCQKCIKGQVPNEPDYYGEHYCIQCGAEHDKYGNLILPKRNHGIEPIFGGRR